MTNTRTSQDQMKNTTNLFFPHFTRSWNNLDKEIREDRDHHNFKEQIKIRLEPPRHPHYKYGDKYANNLINFFFLLNQFLKIVCFCKDYLFFPLYTTS